MDNETPQEGRKPNGQFAKGVNGRQLTAGDFAKPTKKVQLHDRYEADAMKVQATLMAIILDPKTPATARVSAIKEFNDRHLGRPAQTTTIKTSDNDLDAFDLSKFSDAEIRKIVEAARKGE